MTIIINNLDGTTYKPFPNEETQQEKIDRLEKEKKELKDRLELTEDVVYEIMQTMLDK